MTKKKIPDPAPAYQRFNPYEDMKRQRDEARAALLKANNCVADLDKELTTLREQITKGTAAHAKDLRRAWAYQGKLSIVESALIKVVDLATHGFNRAPAGWFGGKAFARKIHSLVLTASDQQAKIEREWLQSLPDEPGHIQGLENRPAGANSIENLSPARTTINPSAYAKD